MDDEKEARVAEAEPPEKPSITAGVTSLIGATVSSITESVKDVASSITAHIMSPSAVSNRVETAHPPVEENFDAPPMTAEEIAKHAAAETQPLSVARKTKRREAAAVKRAAPKSTAKTSAVRKPAKKAAAKAPAKAAKKSKQAKKSAKKANKKTAKTPAMKVAKKKKAKTPGRTVKNKKKAKRG
jgi:hypothetical protein